MLLNILTIYKTGLFHNNALICSKLQTHCLYSIARQLLSVLILYSSLFSLDCSHHTILHILVLGPGLPLLFLTSRGIQQTVSSQKITTDEMCEVSIIEKWQFTGLSQNSSLTNEYWHWTVSAWFSVSMFSAHLCFHVTLACVIHLEVNNSVGLLPLFWFTSLHVFKAVQRT